MLKYYNKTMLKYHLDQFLLNLEKKERDIVLRKYGIFSKEESLGEIAKDYDLSRERVRQIQIRALKKLALLVKNNQKINDFILSTKEILLPLGVRKDEVFNKNLIEKFNLEETEIKIFRLFAILSQFLNWSGEDKYFKSFYSLDKYTSLLTKHILIKIHTYFLRTQKTLTKEEICLLASKEIARNFKLNLSDNEIIEFLTILKDLASNPFNFWGLKSNKFINPKSLRDKIYYLLKIKKRPMHYLEISNLIGNLPENKNDFFAYSWLKRYKSFIIKNELNRNKIFVFLGKGTYGLREWNLIEGSAKELILHFVKKYNVIEKENLWVQINSLREIKKISFLIYLKELEKYNKVKIVDNFIYYV